MLKRLMLPSIALAIASSMLGCALAPLNSNFCAIQSNVIPDPGFETRWTRNEKLQIEKLDEHLDDLCHRPKP